MKRVGSDNDAQCLHRIAQTCEYYRGHSVVCRVGFSPTHTHANTEFGISDVLHLHQIGSLLSIILIRSMECMALRLRPVYSHCVQSIIFRPSVLPGDLTSIMPSDCFFGFSFCH